MERSSAIVVPCYNEADRLPLETFAQFASHHPRVRFVLVNDGSTDSTLETLQRLANRAPDQFDVVDVQPNGGKAAAVRAGMLRAFETGADLAGYWDADLATPLDEIPRFIETLDRHPDRLVVFGARVQLLGRRIQRSARRHYLGRLFATVASNVLRLPVYDTQCGAKLFRASPHTRALFAEPFVSGWTFDVELIARLAREHRLRGAPAPLAAIYELPLNTWTDVPGSRVKPSDFLRAMVELWRIYRTYRAFR